MDPTSPPISIKPKPSPTPPTIGRQIMSDEKTRSFGGTRFEHISPGVPLGKEVERKEAKMYNINLPYEALLRLLQSGQNAASWLCDKKENTDVHKDGVNLVVNFETSRVEFVAPDKR
jgi:hypothetical protein